MNIAASSPLLNSLYSECLPLITPVKQLTRRSNTRRRGSYSKDSENDDENAAFLSSVQEPSGLYLALACVARRREALKRSERGPLLVFVPFDVPRDEIFVEMPISAFGNSRKHQGLRLTPLNEYSVLCSHVKDGLPPQKGLFVTFRTSEAQQRFRDALNQVIHDCIQYRPLGGKGFLQGDSAALPNNTECVSMTETPNEKEELTPPDVMTPRNAGIIESSQGQRSKVRSFIDSLLAERDRRREEYTSRNCGPASISERQSGGIDFSEWAQQHQMLNKKMWNMIVGAAERRTEAEWRAGQHNDTMALQSQLHTAKNVNMSLINPPPLEERELLFHELRAAMEACDNMSAAQGDAEISLMGAACQFLRQHQANLWRLQNKDNMANKPQPSVSDESNNSMLQAVVATTHIPSSLKETSEEALKPSPNSTLKHQEEQQVLQQPHKTLPGITAVVQNVAETLPGKMLEPSFPGSTSSIPALTKQNTEDRLRDELQTAREVESRILSSLRKAPVKPIITKGIFGSTQRTSLLCPLSQITGTAGKGEREGDSEGEKRESVKTAFGTIDVTEPTQMQSDVKANNLNSKPTEDISKETGDKSQVCGSGWKEVRDPASGKKYYVHMATKKTTWKIEDTLKGEQKDKIVEKTTPTCGAQWRVVTDPNTGSTYYVHKATKVTTWQVEKTFVDEDGTPPVETAAKPPPKKKALEWVECKDPSTGKVYYYSRKTKKTTWNRSETDLDLT